MTDYKLRKGKRVIMPDADTLAAAITALPAGIHTDLAKVRSEIAQQHDADQCCPVTVQRLLVTFSETGEVPYWRVVDPERPFARRLVGGGERVREMLARERA
ncbi:MAG: hypothetical protein KC435_06920 [Thermomicrobiales bacterium]|nr:hypothetical protein [Thermomicrobiales bacterium]